MYESLEIQGTLHHVENNGCTTTSYYNAKVNLLKSYTQCADILTTIKREIIPFLLRHLEPYQLSERGQMRKFPFKAHELAYSPICLLVRMYNDDSSYSLLP